MYALVSAIARLVTPGSPWVTVNLDSLTLSQIDSAYTDVYLCVSNPFWTKNRTMLLSEITQDYLERSHTISQFFTAQGSTTLPSTDGIADITKGRVKYADAYWAGYQLDIGRYLASNGPIPHPSEADILIMSKPEVDGRVFHKNCLVSINGLIHRVDADEDFIYVLDAGKSNYHSKRNEVGIINFINVGELECVSITPDMLFKAHPSQPFANQVFIKSPVVAENKTAALVFGGYLFLLDSLTFFRTGIDTFCLDIQSIALLERFFESRHLIDLTSLGLDYNGANNAQISREQLFSDEVLTKWLTLSQSFLVFIDSPDITVSREQLAPTQIAKQYLSYKEPTLPLLGGFGLIQPYWPYEDDNVFSLTVGDNIRPNYLFRTTPPEQVPMPADNRLPYHPQSYNYAYFLDIVSEKIVIIPNT